MRSPLRLMPAAMLAACAQAAAADEPGDWQCATIGVGAAPVIAQAAADFLGRAGQVYPTQLLGVVSAGDRVYLLNARDDGWSERVRLGLMELRLAEPDITARRRFQAAASGAAVVEAPPGDYACLAQARAGRHGLALDNRGRMFLAAGKSVHLVDPREWSVTVEVKAIGAEPLDFREILALSGRAGIYAGLTSRRVRSGSDNPVEGAGGVIEVAIGPSGRPDGEVVVTPRTADSGEKAKAGAAVPALATAPVQARAPAAPAVVAEPAAGAAQVDAPVARPPAQSVPQAPTAAAPAIMAEPPVQVAKANVPVALPDAQPLPPNVPPPDRPVAAADPVVPVVTLSRAPATQPVRSGSAQSYDEYAKAMKSMLALRRSGGVRSVSEMTYVHPAIEDLRNLR